ncbi:MAG: hypothetical protein ACI9EF_000297 [Pseudohongiellaceae bacterium]|jgi:hypothetical protein
MQPSSPLPSQDPVPESPLPGLSHGAFAFSLAVVLTLFLVLNPFWEPMDMNAVDQNIGWSYAPIPLLVGFFLLREGKRHWGAFLMETMRLTFVKFAITWIVANLYWASAGLPEPVPRESGLADVPPAATAGVFNERTAPSASAVNPESLGELQGRVISDDGEPLPGALVFVSDGLQDLTFAPPSEPLVIDHEAGAFSPNLSVLHAFQPLVLRGDDALHSAQVVSESGRVLFTYALLAHIDKRLMFGRPLGLVSLGCTVHGQDKESCRLLVLSHPFTTFADDAGRFTLSGVPAGDLQLSAWSAGRAGSAALTLAAGDTQTVELSLGAAEAASR